MCKRTNSVAAALIIIFSFWQVTASRWLIILSAIVILADSLYSLKREGCFCSFCDMCNFNSKTGGEIFSSVKRGKKPKVPSETEVRETLKKQ